MIAVRGPIRVPKLQVQFARIVHPEALCPISVSRSGEKQTNAYHPMRVSERDDHKNKAC